MTWEPLRSLKLLSALLFILVGSYFFSRGLLVTSFLALVLPQTILFCIPGVLLPWIPPELFTWTRRLLIALFLYSIVVLLSWVLSPYRDVLHGSLISKEARILLSFLAPWSLAYVFLRFSERQRTWLLYLTIFGTLALGAFGVAQWLADLFSWSWSWLQTSSDREGAHGFHHLSLFFAYQLTPVVLFLFGLSIHARSFVRDKKNTSALRAASYAAVLLGALAILGTANRSSLIAFVLMGGIGFLLLHWRSWKIMSLGVLLLFTIVLLSPARQRFQNITQELSAQTRTVLWTAHVKSFLKYPLLGVGRQLNKEKLYRDTAPEEMVSLGEKAWGYSAHSLFLDLLSSVGLLGTLSFLFLWLALPGVLVFRWVKQKGWHAPESAVLFALCLSFGGFFIGALTESVLEPTHMRTMWAFLQSGFLVLAYGHPELFRTS